MSLRDWLFGQPNPAEDPPVSPSSEEIEEARTEVEAWYALMRSAGWPLFEKELEQAAQQALDAMAGGLRDVQAYERASSRLETIKWIMSIPRGKIQAYNEFQQELAMASETTSDSSLL